MQPGSPAAPEVVGRGVVSHDADVEVAATGVLVRSVHKVATEDAAFVTMRCPRAKPRRSSTAGSFSPQLIPRRPNVSLIRFL